MKVELKDVTAGNFEEVIQLELFENQRDYVADNVISIAESRFYPTYRPRAICSAGKVVGFLMYESVEVQGRPVEYEIFRFMVDRRYQGRGIGKKAMELLLDEIKSSGNARNVAICYAKANSAAKALYAGLGFREVGMNSEGEIVAELEV